MRQAAQRSGEQSDVTYPLEHLLSPDILQPSIQIPDLLHHLVNLTLIRTLNLACLSNCQIQCELDAALRLAVAQPTAAGGDILGRKTETMFSRIGGGECEAAF